MARTEVADLMDVLVRRENRVFPETLVPVGKGKWVHRDPRECQAGTDFLVRKVFQDSTVDLGGMGPKGRRARREVTVFWDCPVKTDFLDDQGLMEMMAGLDFPVHKVHPVYQAQREGRAKPE